MKQQQRSAIAVMAASLLGGTGVGVAAAHLAQPASPAQPDAAGPVVTSPVGTATTTALASRIHGLVAGTEQMNRRLVASRLDLNRQLRELGRLRERAALAAAHQTGPAAAPAVSVVSVVSPPAVVPAPPNPPPAAHTTTGASGVAGSGDDDGADTEKEHDDD